MTTDSAETPANGSRGPYAQHTESEKQAAMGLALEHGVAKAAEMTGTATRTLYDWLGEKGGIDQIREVSREATHDALVRSKAAVCEEVTKRVSAGDVKDPELVVMYRAIVDADGKLQLAARTEEPAAFAAAVIRVEIPRADGTVELVNVPRSSSLHRLGAGPGDEATTDDDSADDPDPD